MPIEITKNVKITEFRSGIYTYGKIVILDKALAPLVIPGKRYNCKLVIYEDDEVGDSLGKSGTITEEQRKKASELPDIV